MEMLQEYVRSSYMSLMLLAGLSTILFANRRIQFPECRRIWVIMGLVLLMSVLEFIDDWNDTHAALMWVAHVKTSLVYCIYPLLALLELGLVANIKHKLYLYLPYAAYVCVEIADMFGARLTYCIEEGASFHAGPLRILTLGFNLLYVVILMGYSIRFLQDGSKSKAVIVIFIALSVLLTSGLEVNNLVVNHTVEIAALDIMLYYFYLAAIRHSAVQSELHRREMELEQSKLRLLMAQIKPHFINNALMAIQELCYEDPEKAADTIGHFSKYLRSHFTGADSDQPIGFEEEVSVIREYLALEYADPSKKFRMEFALEDTDFRVPPLSIEPLVENAVKHGIDRYSESAQIILASRREDDHICIEIRDNGKGFDMNAETLGKGGIGLKNAASRLKWMCGGTMQIERRDEWTVVSIRIPQKNGVIEDAHDHRG